MPLRLIIEDDEGTTTIVPLGADSITIGRQQGNTIQLTEKNVSRRHARLTPNSDGWTIEDLNSYNGVKVNGASADGRIALKEGDVIQIGDYHLALTEDVDKRSLNYDGRDAANDPGGEPMLASSSSDLPRLSPEELAALSSGPQTPQPAAMLMDSGPVPAASGMPAAYADDRQQSSGKGLLFVGGGVLVAALIGVFVWMNGSGNAPPDKKVATSESGATAQPGVAPSGVSGATPVPPAPDAPPATGAPPPVDPSGEVAPEDPSGAAVEDPPPVADDSGSEPKRPKKPKKPRKPPKATPPPTPAPTGPTPEELLKDAQKIQFKEPARAYSLAKQSYALKRSQTALTVMAFTACRMKDATKAKSAISKLKGEKRETMAKTCAKQGVETGL